MSDYEMIIKIEIQKTKSKPSDSINKCDDGSFRIVLPKKSAQSIDLCEQALLQTSFPAIREALSQHSGQPLFYGEFYLVVFLFIFTPILNCCKHKIVHFWAHNI